MITPLQPREFFRGRWHGDGEFVPHLVLRPFIRRDRVQFSSEAHWLSDTIWLVNDRMEFGSGWVYERKMFAELVSPDRIHVTADDMPLGADILLHARGFRFTPYHAWGRFRGRVYRMRFTDDCVVDEQGSIHDTICMRYCGFPVAKMIVGPIHRHGSFHEKMPNQSPRPTSGTITPPAEPGVAPVPPVAHR
jgi:hypothetical protein